MTSPLHAWLCNIVCTDALMSVYMQRCQAEWASTLDPVNIPFSLAVCSSSFPFTVFTVITEVSPATVLKPNLGYIKQMRGMFGVALVPSNVESALH